MPAKVILINGVCSSGKSSLCRELLDMLEGPSIYLSLDKFQKSLCSEYRTREWKLYKQQCFALHRTARVWHRQGFNVLIDTVLERTDLYEDARSTLPKAFFVGNFATLETLHAREKERGREDFDLVNYQFERVHNNCSYDLEIHSDNSTPTQLAEEIHRKIYAA